MAIERQKCLTNIFQFQTQKNNTVNATYQTIKSFKYPPLSITPFLNDGQTPLESKQKQKWKHQNKSAKTKF